MHPSLRFIVEKEKDGILPFLDVKIEKSTNEFLTSVYRRPTFTGLHTNWNSFEPPKRKTNLVGILVHRALKICSKSKLQKELNQIRSILQQNGYPEIVINSSIKNTISRFNLEPKEGPQRCPVYVKLPWIGKIFLKFESQIKSAVQKCYGAVEPHVLFSTKNCYQQFTKMRCLPPTKAWSYIDTCAGVTAGTWAAYLKDCVIELHKTSRNPSETNP